MLRILPPYESGNGEKCDSFKLSVEVFDFDELGELSVAFNGVLYFPGDNDELLYIGFGPFNDHSSTLVVIMVILLLITNFL